MLDCSVSLIPKPPSLESARNGCKLWWFCSLSFKNGILYRSLVVGDKTLLFW